MENKQTNVQHNESKYPSILKVLSPGLQQSAFVSFSTLFPKIRILYFRCLLKINLLILKKNIMKSDGKHTDKYNI